MKPQENKTQAPKLEKSKDYEKFHQNSEQRKMSPPHVARLMESMRKNGFFASKPLHVYAVGGSYRVVDGHNRLAAAKELGIEFYYVVESQETQLAIADLNSNVAKWSLSDYVRMYSMRGKIDYQELQKYAETGVSISLAASMLIGNSAASGNASGPIRAGTFKIKTRLQINELVSIIEPMGKNHPVVKTISFVNAFSLCYLSKNIDLARLKRGIFSNPAMLEKTSTLDQMLSQIEAIYNFKHRNKIPLSFIVKQDSTQRNAIKPSKP